MEFQAWFSRFDSWTRFTGVRKWLKSQTPSGAGFSSNFAIFSICPNGMIHKSKANQCPNLIREAAVWGSLCLFILLTVNTRYQVMVVKASPVFRRRWGQMIQSHILIFWGLFLAAYFHLFERGHDTDVMFVSVSVWLERKNLVVPWDSSSLQQLLLVMTTQLEVFKGLKLESDVFISYIYMHRGGRQHRFFFLLLQIGTKFLLAFIYGTGRA